MRFFKTPPNKENTLELRFSDVTLVQKFCGEVEIALR